MTARPAKFTSLRVVGTVQQFKPGQRVTYQRIKKVKGEEMIGVCKLGDTVVYFLPWSALVVEHALSADEIAALDAQYAEAMQRTADRKAEWDAEEARTELATACEAEYLERVWSAAQPERVAFIHVWDDGLTATVEVRGADRRNAKHYGDAAPTITDYPTIGTVEVQIRRDFWTRDDARWTCSINQRSHSDTVAATRALMRATEVACEWAEELMVNPALVIAEVLAGYEDREWCYSAAYGDTPEQVAFVADARASSGEGYAAYVASIEASGDERYESKYGN